MYMPSRKTHTHTTDNTEQFKIVSPRDAGEKDAGIATVLHQSNTTIPTCYYAMLQSPQFPSLL